MSASFKPHTINRPEMPPAGRELSEYERKLAFSREELVGKAVLDLGCGPELRFAAGLEEAGINARVVSLSPDFSYPEHASRASQAHSKGLVAGVGQNLPFRNGVFDAIFAVHVSDHFLTPQIWERAILEVGRVLAPGGVARMGPEIEFPTQPVVGYFCERQDREDPFGTALRQMGVRLDGIDNGVRLDSEKDNDDFRHYNVPQAVLRLTKAAN